MSRKINKVHIAYDGRVYRKEGSRTRTYGSDRVHALLQVVITHNLRFDTPENSREVEVRTFVATLS